VNGRNLLTFSDERWRAQFEARGWSDFEALWNLEADTVEPANVRRGGWSSVVRLDTPDDQSFYLKRQENHDFVDWRGGLRKVPTVVREWDASLAFRKFGVESAEAVCLGVDRRRGHSRGLQITVALDGYRPLPEVLGDGLHGPDRKALWVSLADVVKRIHDHGYRHNCLYGQHLFLKQEDGAWNVRLIDLEKASLTSRRKRATISDLSALDRHTDDMSHRDRLWFWDRYFEDVPLDDRRRLLRTLARRTSLRFVDQYLRDCAAGRRKEI
jgi:hypothetical protein